MFTNMFKKNKNTRKSILKKHDDKIADMYELICKFGQVLEFHKMNYYISDNTSYPVINIIKTYYEYDMFLNRIHHINIGKIPLRQCQDVKIRKDDIHMEYINDNFYIVIINDQCEVNICYNFDTGYNITKLEIKEIESR